MWDTGTQFKAHTTYIKICITRKSPCPEELIALLDLKALLGGGQDHLCFADRSQMRSQTSNALVMCKASLVRRVWSKHKNRSNKYKVEMFRTTKRIPIAIFPEQCSQEVLIPRHSNKLLLSSRDCCSVAGTAAWDGSDSIVHSTVLVTNSPRPQITCADWKGCSEGANPLLSPQPASSGRGISQ